MWVNKWCICLCGCSRRRSMYDWFNGFHIAQILELNQINSLVKTTVVSSYRDTLWDWQKCNLIDCHNIRRFSVFGGEVLFLKNKKITLLPFVTPTIIIITADLCSSNAWQNTCWLNTQSIQKSQLCRIFRGELGNEAAGDTCSFNPPRFLGPVTIGSWRNGRRRRRWRPDDDGQWR